MHQITYSTIEPAKLSSRLNYRAGYFLSLMGERIKVDLGVNPLRNPKCSEVNPYLGIALWNAPLF
jgi:hypothetical protein